MFSCIVAPSTTKKWSLIPPQPLTARLMSTKMLCMIQMIILPWVCVASPHKHFVVLVCFPFFRFKIQSLNEASFTSCGYWTTCSGKSHPQRRKSDCQSNLSRRSRVGRRVEFEQKFSNSTRLDDQDFQTQSLNWNIRANLEFEFETEIDHSSQLVGQNLIIQVNSWNEKLHSILGMNVQFRKNPKPTHTKISS